MSHLGFTAYTREDLEKLKEELELALAAKKKEEQEKKAKEQNVTRARAKAALVDYIKTLGWDTTDESIERTVEGTLDTFKNTHVSFKKETKRYGTWDDFFQDLNW